MDWDPHGIGRSIIFVTLLFFTAVFFLGRASAGMSCSYRIVRVK